MYHAIEFKNFQVISMPCKPWKSHCVRSKSSAQSTHISSGNPLVYSPSFQHFHSITNPIYSNYFHRFLFFFTILKSIVSFCLLSFDTVPVLKSMYSQNRRCLCMCTIEDIFLNYYWWVKWAVNKVRFLWFSFPLFVAWVVIFLEISVVSA